MLRNSCCFLFYLMTLNNSINFKQKMQLLAIGYFTWQYTSIMSLQPEKLHSQSHGHSEACASHTDQSRERPLQMRHTSKVSTNCAKDITHLLIGGAWRGCKQHVGNSSLIPRHFSKRVTPKEANVHTSNCTLFSLKENQTVCF